MPMAERPPPFYMYDGPEFPTPAALLGCRGVARMRPLDEPMAQFYAEIGVHDLLSTHERRVRSPAEAQLFYVPILPHLSQDAGRCNGTSHRSRMAAVARRLLASPDWARTNGTDHLWVCSCVMMHSMLTPSLWSLLSTSIHGVHDVPRGRASPAACQLSLPYYNPTFAAAAPPSARTPGRDRPMLAHFRGRVMNRVRHALVKRYARDRSMLVAAAHAPTAARCNVNKCRASAMAEVGFSPRGHFDEMTRSTFCLVPVGDSPPSSRLFLAIGAGCVPVLISDRLFPPFGARLPWTSFTLRVPESEFLSRKFNLTTWLRRVTRAELTALQTALAEHAADVLYEVIGSRVGTHVLHMAAAAARLGERAPPSGAALAIESRAPAGVWCGAPPLK